MTIRVRMKEEEESLVEEAVRFRDQFLAKFGPEAVGTKLFLCLDRKFEEIGTELRELEQKIEAGYEPDEDEKEWMEGERLKVKMLQTLLGPFKDLSVQSMVKVGGNLVTWDARHPGTPDGSWRFRIRISDLRFGEFHEDRIVSYHQAQHLHQLLDEVGPACCLVMPEVSEAESDSPSHRAQLLGELFDGVQAVEPMTIPGVAAAILEVPKTFSKIRS